MTRPRAYCLVPGLPGSQATADRKVNAHVNGHGEGRAASVKEYLRTFPAVPGQVREARGFLADILVGCPVADDAILCLSELASNCVLHSASRQPGGRFTVRAEVGGNYVRIALHDNGGPWIHHRYGDERRHGLDIVRSLAAESGVHGDAVTGWISWARFRLAQE